MRATSRLALTVTSLESFFGGDRAFLPRTGGTSLKNTGRSFFARGGASLPGANAFRGVDPLLLSAFMPQHKCWSQPRAGPADEAGTDDSAAATKDMDGDTTTSKEPKSKGKPQVQALLKTKNITAAAAAPAAPAAPAAAPSAAETKTDTSTMKEEKVEDTATGLGTLSLPGTVGRPTGSTSTAAAAAASVATPSCKTINSCMVMTQLPALLCPRTLAKGCRSLLPSNNLKQI